MGTIDREASSNDQGAGLFGSALSVGLSGAIGLDCMRQENAGAKQSEERDCYLKHGTHPYATSPRWYADIQSRASALG